MENGQTVITQGLGKEEPAQSRGKWREVHEGICSRDVVVWVELTRDTWGQTVAGSHCFFQAEGAREWGMLPELSD